MLEFRPEEARWFNLEWENSKYRIFRIVSEADEEQVNDLVALAWDALLRGDHTSARRMAMVAQRIVPRDPQAARVLAKLAELSGDPEPPSVPPSSD